MKTSWQRHRPHAIASLVFRAASAAGFAAGLAFALTRAIPPTPSCALEQGDCVARLLRFEALYHVAGPVAGLAIGMIAGSWLAKRVHALYARS